MKTVGAIVLCLILAGNSELHAQGDLRSYKDSVKEFFQSAPKRYDTGYILNNAGYISNEVDSFLWKSQLHLFTKIKKVYKFGRGKQYGNRPIDSITLTLKETKYAAKRMQNPTLNRWDYEVFPYASIISQEEVDSFYIPYWAARKNLKIDDPVIKKYRSKKLFLNGYRKLANPIFLRNGSVALLYNYHFFVDYCVGYGIDVFKKENGEWYFFDYILGGNVN